MMKKRTEMRCLFIVGTLSLVLPVLASPGEKWQNLRQRYLNLKSLAGSFTETIEPADDTGQDPIVFKGRFVFQLPHCFRLEVEQPVSQVIIGNDSVVWFYFPDEKRAVLQTNRQPVPLLSFIQPLLDSTTKIIEEGAGILAFADNTAGFLNELRLELDKTNTRIIAFSFVDEMGNHCRFQLENQRWNPQVPAKTFRFIPPARVTVEYQ